MRDAGANTDHEGGATSFLTGDGDGAAMQTHQFLHKSQTDARPLVGARANVLDAVEALEHARQIRVGDAHAGIADAQLDVVAAPLERDANPSLEGELERIREQIEDD